MKFLEEEWGVSGHTPCFQDSSTFRLQRSDRLHKSFCWAAAGRELAHSVHIIWEVLGKGQMLDWSEVQMCDCVPQDVSHAVWSVTLVGPDMLYWFVAATQTDYCGVSGCFKLQINNGYHFSRVSMQMWTRIYPNARSVSHLGDAVWDLEDKRKRNMDLRWIQVKEVDCCSF